MRAHRIEIARRAVGEGAPTFVVAEAGVNHNGDVELALRLVDIAADAGANAVKFQTFSADALVTESARKAGYQQATTGAGESQRDMLRRLELDADAHARLQAHAAARGLVFFSTPFDEASADLLDTLEVPALKVPSGELTNLPLLRHLAAKKRPLILSTGMGTLAEVEVAVDAIRAAGDPPLAVLHCVSAYPAPPAEVNLRAMDTLRARFGCPVGLSDHTLGTAIALAAVARGAAILEKHMTADRTLPGPDHRASLEPAELAAMIRAIREIESALGDGEKRPMPSERDTREVARRSLVAARPIARGERLARGMLAIKRPGTGIPPAALEEAIGRAARRDIRADEVLRWEDLER